MSNNNGFTPTQKKMLDILADGRIHTKEELHTCCGPSSLSVVAVHIVYLRKKLRPIGQDIVCVFERRRIHYRQVRLLGPADDGSG